MVICDNWFLKRVKKEVIRIQYIAEVITKRMKKIVAYLPNEREREREREREINSFRGSDSNKRIIRSLFRLEPKLGEGWEDFCTP